MIQQLIVAVILLVHAYLGFWARVNREKYPSFNEPGLPAVMAATWWLFGIGGLIVLALILRGVDMG